MTGLTTFTCGMVRKTSATFAETGAPLMPARTTIPAAAQLRRRQSGRTVLVVIHDSVAEAHDQKDQGDFEGDGHDADQGTGSAGARDWRQPFYSSWCLFLFIMGSTENSFLVVPREARDLGVACELPPRANTKVPRFARDDSRRA